MKIGIYIYDQAEVLDFAGPFEVFTTAAQVSGQADLCQVFLIGETGHTVHARAGFKVKPDFSFQDCPALDILMVVGGYHLLEMQNRRSRIG